MSFNSLENQHGIVVTMVFNINGYRYERESLINNSDSIGDMVFKKKSKNDKLFGSFLEIYNNYLNITKENLAALEITPLENYTSFEINVNKTWEDNNNAENKRPQSIKYILKGGAAEVEQVVSGNRTTNANWNYKFTNLPKMDWNL